MSVFVYRYVQQPKNRTEIYGVALLNSTGHTFYHYKFQIRKTKTRKVKKKTMQWPEPKK